MTDTSHTSGWSQETKRIVTIISLIVLVLLAYLARSALSLVALAAVLAYIFQPLVGWLERRRVPRGLAAGVSVLLLIVLVALGPVILIPVVVEQVREIVDALGAVPPLLQKEVLAFLEEGPKIELVGFRLDLSQLAKETRDILEQAAGDVQLPSLAELISYGIQGVRTAGGLLGTAAGIATGVVTAVASSLLAGLLLLMYVFYLTKDGIQLRPWLLGLVLPPYRPEVDDLLRRLNLTWRAFFRGQILLSLSVGIVTFLATALLGLPGALVLGILAGILEVVPNLGPVLAMIPAVILALVQGSTYLPVENWVFALVVVGVYVLMQQVENNFLVPRIMGHSLDLHPMLVLVGVVVGTATAGILGAFLAAPVLASLKVLGTYVHAKLTDQDTVAGRAPVQEPAMPRPAKALPVRPADSVSGEELAVESEPSTESERAVLSS